MSDTVEIIIKAKDQASSAFKSVGAGATALGTVIGNVMSDLGRAVVSGFVNVVKSSIAVNAQLETTTLQFETLMGDAQKAEEHVKSLFEFAERTPFETGPIIEASLKLETFGGAALNTKDNLYLLGDAAAATNAPIDELGFWVGRLYANLQAGQPFGEAAMRLQELAVMSPKARQAMEELQKAGGSASEIFAILQEDLGRFEGAMEKQASTWEGMVSTIKDQLSLLVADAMKPFFKNAKEGLGDLIKLLNDPDIVNGIKAMGAELGKVADAFFDLTGGVLRFIAAIGQAQENDRIFEQLGLSTAEVNALLGETAERLGIVGAATNEEHIAVQVAMMEIVRDRYAAELMLVDGINARSEAEDWANDVTRQMAEETRRAEEAARIAATSIQNVTTDVIRWRLESDLMTGTTKDLSTGVEIMGGKLAPLAGIMQDNATATNNARIAAENLKTAFLGLVGDYLTELPGQMEPLISITEGVAGAQGVLAVNTDAAKVAIFNQLVEMGAAPEVIAIFGEAIGVMTREQVIAAIAATLLKDEIQKMANKIAEGVPVDEVLADFDSVVDKINNELIPAAMDASTDIPAAFGSMIEPTGQAASDVAGALIDGLVEGITAGVPDTTAAAEDAANAVITTTKRTYQSESPSKVFEGIGADLMLGLLQGLNREVATVITRVTELGRNIIQGMINGLLNAAGALYATIADIIGRARAAAGAAAGEGSPARLFIPLGESIAEGIIEGIYETIPEAEAAMKALVDAINKVGGLAGGFGSIFENRNIKPLEFRANQLRGELGHVTAELDEILKEYGLSSNTAALREILTGQLGASPLAGNESALRRALTYLDARESLLKRQKQIEDDLIRNQNELLRLEAARANFGFLQQRFELLKMVRDNNLGAEILEGLQLGIGADPGALMQAMVRAMEAMIRAAENELGIASPSKWAQRTMENVMGTMADTVRRGSPAVADGLSLAPARSLPEQFFGRVGNTTTINIDARGAERGAAGDIRRVVEQVLREQGTRADIRMRTT